MNTILSTIAFPIVKNTNDSNFKIFYRKLTKGLLIKYVPNQGISETGSAENILFLGVAI